MRKHIGSVTLSSTSATGVNFTLLNEDCDGDGEVTIFDYIILSNNFGKEGD